MVTVQVLSGITIQPNPVETGRAFMVTVTFVNKKLTWREAAKYRWGQMKAWMWGDP